MKKNPGAIYATHSIKKPLFYKVKVNGVLCAAYVKDGRLISYEPWEEINRQMYTGPCLHFTVSEKDELDHPNA